LDHHAYQQSKAVPELQLKRRRWRRRLLVVVMHWFLADRAHEGSADARVSNDGGLSNALHAIGLCCYGLDGGHELVITKHSKHWNETRMLPPKLMHC
jgi:hypothetical protein